MMYYYWKHGRVRPSVLYQMPKGELTVIQAFYERELQENSELISRASNGGVVYNIGLTQ
ncbi:hypothetical protein LJC58_02110 [Lachnospiraceae bacterium OttesenSCG-928-D06]|nr:hypothetical protein [Lachnospiraceae bacterium OttesenSCG-928-D06]